MEPRDRLINIATLLAAGVAWIVVVVIVTTQDPRAIGQAVFIGAVVIGIAVGLTAIPLLWLMVFGRHARIAYRGDWLRAFRRGGVGRVRGRPVRRCSGSRMRSACRSPCSCW